MNQKLWIRLGRHPAAIVAIFSAVAAVAWWCLYSPVYDDDSAYYLLLAGAIRQGTFFHQDIGGRTPLFPLFVAILGGSRQAVFAGNLVLGVLTAVLIFRIFSIITESTAWAMAIAFIYALNPSTIRFERTVMTEMLACFLVSLGAWFAVSACKSQGNFAFRVGLSSLTFSLAALTRPVFQLLPLATLAAIIALTWKERPRRGPISQVLAAGLIPFLVLVMGWEMLNYARFGWFTLSTFSGYHLTNHTGQFMNDAPPQYAKITSIYLRYQEAHLRQTGMRANAIWEAKEEIKQATGMNDVQLSRLLLGLSARLIITHPTAYLQSVGRSFKRFWRPPVYARGCNVGDFRNGLREIRAGQTSLFAVLYPYFYLLTTLAYFMSLGGPLVIRPWRKSLWTPGAGVVHLVIIYTAVISSFFEYGENNRFKFPVEALILGMAVAVCHLLFAKSGRTNGQAHGPAEPARTSACTTDQMISAS